MALRLLDLEPQFYRYGSRREVGKFHVANGYMEDPAHVHTDACFEEREHDQVFFTPVDIITEAQGINFLCPKCFAANGGSAGTHRVICWSRSAGVPEDVRPGPGRWKLVGTGYHDLTLDCDPGSRSVALQGGCAWHGFVTNGEVTDA